MSKEVPTEGHGQGMLGTVRVGVHTVWQGPVSLLKPRSPLRLFSNFFEYQ